MYNDRLNKSSLSTRESSYENRKPNSSMYFPSDPDSLFEELKPVHLQCYIWLNDLKPTLPSLNIEFDGWEVRGDCNGAPVWFSGNQLSPSKANSSETDLKKNRMTKTKTKVSTNNATSR